MMWKIKKKYLNDENDKFMDTPNEVNTISKKITLINIQKKIKKVKK